MSFGKDSPAPPPAPDYAGAATATAAGNLDAARLASKANRVNQYTPYGSLIYQNHLDGDPDRWNSTVNLSPAGQQLFDLDQATNVRLGNLAQKGLGFVEDTLSKPFDWGNVAAAPVNPGMTAQNAIMARLQPQLDRQRDQLRTQLMNQGFSQPTGSGPNPGWDAAMTEQNQRENDLLSQAALQGISLDTAARQQGIQEEEFRRTEPLNILNAVRSSAPVTMPQFQQTPQQATVPGPDYLNAANAGYQGSLNAFNAEQARNSSAMSGLASIGGGLLSSGMFGNPFGFGGGAPKWGSLGYGGGFRLG